MLIVGVDRPGLCDLLSGARISRLDRAHWPENLLVGKRGGEVRAVKGAWDNEVVPVASIFRCQANDPDLQELERLVSNCRTHTRLAAGSPFAGQLRTLAAPIETMSLEV